MVCCGNPDRGDDDAGHEVARLLTELGIPAHEHRGDAVALMDAWQGAADVVLVDAVVTGERPGTLTVWDLLTSPWNGHLRTGSSHVLGLAEAVALARSLDCLPQRLMLYGIESRCFDLGRSPSRAVQRGAARAARKIYEYCVDQRVPAV